MNRPTREQIEQARALVLRLDAEASHLPDSMRDALRTLLAATAPPTDEELAQEATRCPRREGSADWASTFLEGYIAGARREGGK